MRKELVLKISVSKLLKDGADSLTLSGLTSEYKLAGDGIKALFPNGDRELLMDTVEYAGQLWIQKLEQELETMDAADKQRVEFLVREYINGTASYANSLSVYIDLWKMLKESSDPFIRNRLREIYRLYIQKFETLMEKIVEWKCTEKEKTAFATLMTVLSDTLHVQDMIFQDEFDVEEVIALLVRFTFSFVKER